MIPADYEDFYALRLAGLEECPAAFTTDAEAWRNASSDAVERLLERGTNREDMPILGAWVEDQLVGMVGLNRELRPSVAHKATLWGFYVSPQFRRQGIGSTLLRTMLSIARDVPDLRQIRAVVNASSFGALALFANIGFEQFGREPAAKQINGAFSDQIYVWYLLKEG